MRENKLRNQFLIFIAHVGATELESMYGQKMAKDMIGIDKVDWKDMLIKKHPAAKSMTQTIIGNTEWSHPYSFQHTGVKIDLNPFIIAATKHMTDIIGLSPKDAINATMITANDNITVAANNAMGQGFVVIGVPFK